MVDFPRVGIEFDIAQAEAATAAWAGAEDQAVRIGRAYAAAGLAATAAANEIKAAASTAASAPVAPVASQASSAGSDAASGAARAAIAAQAAAIAGEMEAAAVTILTTSNTSSASIRAAVSRLFAPDALTSTDRSRFAAQLAETFSAIEAEITDGAVTLVTESTTQAFEIQAAVSRLFAPPASSGIERTRMQAALTEVFSGIEADIVAGTVTLVTESETQALEIQAAVANLFAPPALAGAERARMQASLEATFADTIAQIEAESITLVTVADNQALQIQAAMARLFAPAALSGTARLQQQASLEAAFQPTTDATGSAGATSAAATAAAADADAEVKLAQAKLQAASAGPPTVASLIEEKAALDELTEALARQVAARGELAAVRATSIGANPELASAAAGIGSASVGATAAQNLSERASQVGFIDNAAAALGMSGALEAVKDASGALGDALGGLTEGLRSLRLGLTDARVLLGVFLAGMIIEPIIGVADAMTQLEAKVTIFAGSASSVPTVLEQIYTSAQNARVPLEQLASLYTRINPILAEHGKGSDDSLRIAQTVSESYAIAGTPGQQQKGLTQDITQGLAAPTFNSRELRASLGEDLPLIQAIATGLGMTLTQFDAAVKAGTITSSEFTKGLIAASSTIDSEFAKTPVTVGQSVTQVENAFQHLIGVVNDTDQVTGGIARLGQSFATFLSAPSTIEGVVAAVHDFQVAMQVLGTVFSTVASNLPTILTGLAGLVAGLSVGPVTAFAASIAELVGTMGLAAFAETAMATGAEVLKNAFTALEAASPAILFTALATAAGFLYDQQQKANSAISDGMAAIQSTSSAISGAASFLQKYGGNAADASSAINGLADAEAGRATATGQTMTADQQAQKAAQSRLDLDQAQYVQQLLSIAREEQARQGHIDFALAVIGIENAFNDAEIAVDTFFSKLLDGVAKLPQLSPAIRDVANVASQAFAGDAKSAGNARAIGNQDAAALTRERQMSGASQAAALAAASAVRGSTLTATIPTGGTGIDTSTATALKGAEAAQKAIDAVKDSIRELNTELDQANAFDTSPLADAAAKIQKAYDDAYNKFSNTKNPFEKAQATSFAGLSADNERLKLSSALASALIKEAGTEEDKENSIVAATAATTAANAAIDAYYTGGVKGSAAYVTALQAQGQALLDGADKQSELTIASKFGVTSVNDISAALQNYLGLSKTRADQIQVEAQKTLALADAVNQLAATEKAEAAQQAQHTTALENIADLTAEASAYTKGRGAIALYTSQKAIAAAQKAAPAAPGQDAVAVGNQQEGDVLNEQLQTANVEAAKLLATSVQQTSQVGLTSEQQARMNDALIVAAQLVAQSRVDAFNQAQVMVSSHQILESDVASYVDRNTLSQKLAISEGLTLTVIKQQVDEANKLKASVQESIEKAFTDTGSLDFSSLTTAVEQSFRKAIYDQLLAQPINVVINATLDIEKQAINSLLGSAGSSGSGLLGSLGGLFGGSSTTGFASDINNLNSMNNLQLGTLTDATTGLSTTVASTTTTQTGSLLSGLGSLGSVFTSGLEGLAAGSVAGSALGVKQTGATTLLGAAGGIGGSLAGASLSAAGGALSFLGAAGGPIGAIVGGIAGDLLGSLFSSQPSNNGATAQLDPSGDVTAIQGNKATAATTSAITSVADTIQGTISSLQQYGIDASGIIKAVITGTRDPSQIYFDNGTSNLNAGAPGDTAAFETSIADALLKNATYTDPGLQKVVQQLITSNASLDEINATIANYSAAQSFTTGNNASALQYTDPLAYQLSQLQTTQAARQTTLTTDEQSGFLTPDQEAAAQASVTNLDTAEINNALLSYATTTTGATHSMADFVTAQAKVTTYLTTLATGSLSPLSPTDQLALDLTTFQGDITGAQAGNYDDLDASTTDANTYLTEAQKYYGSSGQYQSIYNNVVGQLQSIGTGTDVDPQTAAIQTASADLTAAIGSSADTIVAAINKLLPTTTTATPAASSTSSTDNTAVVTAVTALNTTLISVGSGIAAATTSASASQTAALTTAAAVQSALSGGVLAAGGTPANQSLGRINAS